MDNIFTNVTNPSRTVSIDIEVNIRVCYLSAYYIFVNIKLNKYMHYINMYYL